MSHHLNILTINYLKIVPGTQTIDQQKELLTRANLPEIAAKGLYHESPEKFLNRFFQTLTSLKITEAIESVLAVLRATEGDLPPAAVEEVDADDEEEEGEEDEVEEEKIEPLTFCTALIADWELYLEQARLIEPEEEEVSILARKLFTNLLIALFASLAWLLVYSLVCPNEFGSPFMVVYLLLPIATFIALGFFITLMVVFPLKPASQSR